MFVITVKSKLKTKKAKILLAAVALVLLLFIIFTCVSAFSFNPPSKAKCGDFEYSTLAKTDEQVEEFAEQFYEVDELYSLQEIYVPVEFNDKYEHYNDLQKQQGLDLEPYKGEKCKLYMYSLSDFKIDGEDTFMSVIVYRDRVIGGDISNQVMGGESLTFNGEQVY